MGQAQSDAAASEAASDGQSRGGPSSSPSPGGATSLDSLIAGRTKNTWKEMLRKHVKHLELTKDLILNLGQQCNITGLVLASSHEAAAYANDENESLDAKAQKALECPCIADLRSGPCGNQFSEAFACFLKSTAEEKGSDCVHPFVALQNCIKANPGAFSKDVLEGDNDDVKKEEEPKQDYQIIPPTWSKESHNAKSKL